MVKVDLHWAALLISLSLVASGCATRQSIPVECTTETVKIFVDGQLMEGNPDLLELSTDEPHVVFIRAEGFVPQQYIFEPELDEDGEPRLTPGNICVELVPVGQGRRLEVEVDDPALEP
jgi:hypothetical protein